MPCNMKVESAIHYFLYCHHFNKFGETLLDFFEMTVKDISNIRDDTLVNFILNGNPTHNFEEKTKIIKASINYIFITS